MNAKKLNTQERKELLEKLANDLGLPCYYETDTQWGYIKLYNNDDNFVFEVVVKEIKICATNRAPIWYNEEDWEYKLKTIIADILDILKERKKVRINKMKNEIRSAGIKYEV